jgi:hypothetical protein
VQRGAQDYLLKGRLDGYLLSKALRSMLERAASAEALFDEKERAQVTLNSIGDAVMSSDVCGHVTYLNVVVPGAPSPAETGSAVPGRGSLQAHQRHPGACRVAIKFVTLLSEVTHAEDAAVCAEKILRALSAPYRIDKHNLHLTASIGIVTYPMTGRTREH